MRIHHIAMTPITGPEPLDMLGEEEEEGYWKRNGKDCCLSRRVDG